MKRIREYKMLSVCYKIKAVSLNEIKIKFYLVHLNLLCVLIYSQREVKFIINTHFENLAPHLGGCRKGVNKVGVIQISAYS